METIITLGVSAICIGLTVLTIHSYLVRKIMNARRFAGFFAIGSSVTMLVFFFFPFILESRPLELEFIALGFGITVLIFVIGYLLAYTFYSRFYRLLR